MVEGEKEEGDEGVITGSVKKRARDKHLSLGEGSRYVYQNSSDSSS